MLDEAGPGTEPVKIAGPDAGLGDVSLRRDPPSRVVALGFPRSSAHHRSPPKAKGPVFRLGLSGGTLTMTPDHLSGAGSTLAAAAALDFALKSEVSLRRNRLWPVVALRAQSLRAQSLSVSAPHTNTKAPISRPGPSCL